MPWKNGLGLTDQIDLSSSAATSSTQGYDWRLSSALVTASNPFSIFTGYQRLLGIVEGDGLLLNQTPLLPGQVCEFSGDNRTDCQLLGSQVRDIGLIYNPKTHRASMKFHTLPPISQSVLSLPNQIHYFYIVHGKMRALKQTALAGDCFKISNESTLQIENTESQPMLFYEVSLSAL